MTYTAYDKSAALGSPYEMFAFICATGNYYYTDNGAQVVFEGNTYLPLQIARGVLEFNALTDSVVTTQISVPTNCPLFYDHGRGLVHPEMTVEIRRAHRDTTGVRLRGVGRVTTHSVTDEMYNLQVENVMQTEAQQSVASVYYLNKCNHVFGDDRCKVDLTAYQRTSFVQELWNYSVKVANDGFANGALVNGKLIIGPEIRTILDNEDNWITLAYPFVEAQIGDDCTLQLECDLTFTMCGSKFGNTDRYGGFPTMPEVNPATPDFEVINTQTTKVTDKLSKEEPFDFGFNISGSMS